MSERNQSRTSALGVLPLLVSLIVTALVFWVVDIVSPALPALKSDLGLSAKLTGLIYAALFLGRLIGNFPAARLVETSGPRTTGTLGGIALAFGSLLIAAAPGAALIFPGRVLQGIGIAFVVNAVLRSLLLIRPDRGAAIAFFQFSSTIGTVLGLEVGGAVTEREGWRAVFALSIAIAAVIAVIALIARSPRASATVASGLPIETSPAAAATWPAKLPSLGFNFLVFANYSIFVVAPLYTEQRFGATAELNANLLMVITLMHLAGAFPTGRMIPRWGARLTLALGIAGSCAAMVLIPLAPSALWIAPPLALYGLGMIAASNAAGDYVLEMCGRNVQGIGLLRLTCDLGLVIGPFAAGALVDAFGDRSPFYVLPAISLAPLILAFRCHSNRVAQPRIEPAAS
jgi:MFS family permease